MTNLQFKSALQTIKNEFDAKIKLYDEQLIKLKKSNKIYANLDKSLKENIIKNAELGNGELDKKITDIENQMHEIEKKSNIVKPKPACQVCNDTGKVGEQICNCVKRIVNKELIKKSNIAEINLKELKDCDFSNLDEQTKKSQQKVYKFFETEIINNFKNTKYKNVVVCGAPGVGKTFLFSVVAGELLKRNISTVYISAFSLNNLFLKYHTTFTENKFEILEPLETCECLLIDDLGTEPILNNVTGEYLLQLLKERVMSGKVTLINSNLMLDAINDRYGERIFSRMVDKSNSIAILMQGKNKRI